jgi:aminopeptidase N
MASDRRRRMPIAALGSNNIYPKGALVLEMLRKYLGEERFWAGVHRYLADHAYGNATTDDFRQAMLAATGENLDWFMDQWFYQAGFPEFKVISYYDKTADRLTLFVQQTQADTTQPDSTGFRFTTPSVFRMPATIRVGSTRGDITRRVMLDARMQTFTFDSLGGAPAMVIFDDGNTILKKLTFDQPTAWLAAQLSRDPDLWDRQWVIDLLAKRDSDAAAGAALARAATGADYYLTRVQAADAIGSFPAAIALPTLTTVLSDTSAAVRAAALRGLRTLGGDSAFALAKREFDHDPSYEVRAAALRALSNAPYAEQKPLLARALTTWSYRNVIGDAAVLSIAAAGDTSFLDAVNAQVGNLAGAPYALAAFGRRGSAHAYDLLAAHLLDKRRATRQTVAQVFATAVPKTIAMGLVENAQGRTADPALRAELGRLLTRIQARPDAG